VWLEERPRQVCAAGYASTRSADAVPAAVGVHCGRGREDRGTSQLETEQGAVRDVVAENDMLESQLCAGGHSIDFLALLLLVQYKSTNADAKGAAAGGLNRPACRAARLLSVLYGRDPTQVVEAVESSSEITDVGATAARPSEARMLSSKGLAAAPDALLSRKLTCKLGILIY
jgi:hypothetical protein